MKVAEGIYFIPCPIDDPLSFTGSVAIIGDTITIVDTGMPNSPEQAIFPFIKSIGRDPKEIKHIVLTHCHFDHVAGVGEIRKFSGAEVVIHEDDYPYVKDPDLIDLDLSSRFPDILIDERQSKFDPVLDCRIVKDKDILKFSGHEFRIVHVPGHSAGSICFVESKLGVYIAGDSVQGKGGGTSPFIFYNAERYVRSMEMLRHERINFLVLAHPFAPFYKGVLSGEQCQIYVEASIKAVNELSSKVLQVLHKAQKPMSLTEIYQKLPNTVEVTVGSILEKLLSEKVVSVSKDTLQWSSY